MSYKNITPKYIGLKSKIIRKTLRTPLDTIKLLIKVYKRNIKRFFLINTWGHHERSNTNCFTSRYIYDVKYLF